VIAYASATGTRRNLAALRGAGWRLLLSPTGALRPVGFRYALDNGAWTAYQRGTEFDGRAFARALDSHGAGADWIVIPDIVAGGRRSLEFSMRWLPTLLKLGRPLLLAVQDGMQPADVADPLSGRVGLFVGGSTGWKEQTACRWGQLARERGCWLLVARRPREHRPAHPHCRRRRGQQHRRHQRHPLRLHAPVAGRSPPPA
jgi:hypothetical protein